MLRNQSIWWPPLAIRDIYIDAVQATMNINIWGRILNAKYSHDNSYGNIQMSYHDEVVANIEFATSWFTPKHQLHILFVTNVAKSVKFQLSPYKLIMRNTNRHKFSPCRIISESIKGLSLSWISCTVCWICLKLLGLYTVLDEGRNNVITSWKIPQGYRLAFQIINMQSELTISTNAEASRKKFESSTALRNDIAKLWWNA